MMERHFTTVRDPAPLPEELTRSRVNILLVVARPYANDITPRLISRPLAELLAREQLPVEITILRPPTIASLRRHLADRPYYYHLVHFDCHGGIGNFGSYSSEGFLALEGESGHPDLIRGSQLGAVLREHRIPAVILSASRSATIAADGDNVTASLASALLGAGVRVVVAMAHGLHTSAVEMFFPAFYNRLLKTGDFSEATRAGRQQLLANRGRVCAHGTHGLEDWLVPVLYQQEPFDIAFARPTKPAGSSSEPFALPALADAALPAELSGANNPYGFIGRDGPLLELERAMHRPPAGILINGIGGVGKTTLARGFARWLIETGGLEATRMIWFRFDESIRNAEYVINRIGEALLGTQFIALELAQRMAALGQILKENQFLIVWDNFEVVRGMPGAAIPATMDKKDRDLLQAFLSALRGGKTKVLITSRSPEDWIERSNRVQVSIGGLHGEERWEYCSVILRDLGIQVDRDDPHLAELMNELDGHPLAMRVVLPELERARAQTLMAQLTSNLHAGTDNGSKAAETKLFATLRFVEDGLPDQFRPLLLPLSLHERFIDADYLEAMAQQADPSFTRATIDRFLQTLAIAGLVHELGQAVYDLHPLLTRYLRAPDGPSLLTAEPAEPWRRAFVDIMGRLADSLAHKQLHEQRGPFLLFGASFRYALTHAEALDMQTHVAMLVQSLATYALHTHDYPGARELFQHLADWARAQDNAKQEAGAYHQLGRIAQEQRDFASAEAWFKKSLAISEKQGNEHGAATTYHQLGIIAQEQRDFAAAEAWYKQSLAIKEKQGNDHGVAMTYHQLGRIAQEQRDFASAEVWFKKSLVISEKQGNDHGAAMSYHKLGIIAQEQRDFAAAEAWYKQSLAIKEKQGNEHSAAMTYHQLGIIAQEQRDFAAAEAWYKKSLAIKEKQGNDHGAANTYHQLGIMAQEQRDFAAAEAWYKKSLAIKEKQGNDHGAAMTYHQLGIIAQEQRDFAAAEAWYKKSLAIKEKQGNDHGAASTYHQLGIIAQEQRDFAAAEAWYKKSLAIKEKQGNDHGAAMTIGQLGILAGLQQRYEDAGRLLIRCVMMFTRTGDMHSAQRNASNFLVFYRQADGETQETLKALWAEAGLPPLPEPSE